MKKLPLIIYGLIVLLGLAGLAGAAWVHQMGIASLMKSVL